MIIIYTSPERMAEILELIHSQERMYELVEVRDFFSERPIASGMNIIVNSQGIATPVDWQNMCPPYIFQENFFYSPEILLACIYLRLNNMQMVKTLLQNEGSILAEFMNFDHLRNGEYINPDKLAVETYRDFDDYRLMHNHAVIRQYSPTPRDEDNKKIHYFFNTALNDAPDDEHAAFTAKHYMNFLIDTQDLSLAEKVGMGTLDRAISKDAQIEIKYLLAQIWMQRMSPPYDQDLLVKVKDTLWEVLEYYEENKRTIEHALILEDASFVANILESYTESLGYITKAIRIYQDEQVEDLYYNACFRKAQLLYTWAQNGQIQFYKPAIDSFQEAVKYFSKEDYPEKFAEIQSYLGVIYSEIPDEVKKKSIWAAVSYSAFAEALSVFTKESYPYEYAYVCNNFANALTKYPVAKLSDNHEKALFYYNEALSVRTPQHFPMERAMTLLNYIEAAWYADNSENEVNPQRFDDMWIKAHEVITLNVNIEFNRQAQEHLDRLEQLRSIL